MSVSTMEILAVVVIVMLAVGLTARSLYRKFSNRLAGRECGETCLLGTDCHASTCHPTEASRETGTARRSGTDNSSHDTHQ